MKIYPLKEKEGRVFAFEVGNFSRRRVCHILSSIPGVKMLRTPCLLSRFREDEFCEFEISGQRFKAWEPWGDNSRYWIGPEPTQWGEQISVVLDAFRKNGHVGHSERQR